MEKNNVLFDMNLHKSSIIIVMNMIFEAHASYKNHSDLSIALLAT